MTNLFFLLALFSGNVDPLPTDCSNEGKNKVLIHTTDAGSTYLIPNTARWCDPIGSWIAPQEDPTFINNK